MNRKRSVYQFMAKALVIIMIFQGMPLWELSNVYKWEYQPEKLQKILDVLSVFGPTEAKAITRRSATVSAINIPGTSDPWLAGMPDGSTASFGDAAPAQSPVQITGLSFVTGNLLTFEVSGSVSFTSSPSGDGPDGRSICGTPQLSGTATLTVSVTMPPHPPSAVIGGPYIAVVGEDVQADGSGSYDIDESDGDSITARDWETDFTEPYDYGEAQGETPVLPAYTQAGVYSIGLRVTDNTATVFPESGQPNLTGTAESTVTVFKAGVTDLSARPKGTKCQLLWTHIGVSSYEVLRSDKGPNHGFELIGTTESTYSAYIDYNVEMKKDYWYRVRAELDGETVLSGPFHIYSQGLIRNYPPVFTSEPVTAGQETVVYQYD
ncbi:MAG: hypothetical protein GY765_05955, partial [bacterium]|nr:hypothetical protein [bacterium]